LRLYYDLLESVEDALFMVRPLSHPLVADRRIQGLQGYWKQVGPDGSLSWSNIIEQPLRALIALARLPAPWADARQEPFDAVCRQFGDLLTLSPVLDDCAEGLGALERFDMFCYFPPQRQAEILGQMVSQGTLDSIADPYSELSVEYSDAPEFPNLMQSVGAVDALRDAARGRVWFERFIHQHRLIDRTIRPVEMNGLRFATMYWTNEVKELPFSAAIATWALLAQRAGWDCSPLGGLRRWGALPGVGPPSVLMDVSAAISSPNVDEFS
jgi:hypothetical protein